MGNILPSEWITLFSLAALLILLLWLLRHYRRARICVLCWACTGVGALFLCTTLVPNTILPLTANLFTGAVSVVLGVPGVCLLTGACLSLF